MLRSTTWPKIDRPCNRANNDKMISARARKRLSKRAKKGFRGFPVATVAFYGPDDTTASKLTVGIVPDEDGDRTDLRRWFSETTDIRNDAGVAQEVRAFIDAAGARSVVMTDKTTSKLMLIGYARVSTVDQNLALQRDALTEAGCQKLA